MPMNLIKDPTKESIYQLLLRLELHGYWLLEATQLAQMRKFQLQLVSDDCYPRGFLFLCEQGDAHFFA